jgi:hypothetical protein
MHVVQIPGALDIGAEDAASTAEAVPFNKAISYRR